MGVPWQHIVGCLKANLSAINETYCSNCSSYPSIPPKDQLKIPPKNIFKSSHSQHDKHRRIEKNELFMSTLNTTEWIYMKFIDILIFPFFSAIFIINILCGIAGMHTRFMRHKKENEKLYRIYFMRYIFFCSFKENLLTDFVDILTTLCCLELLKCLIKFSKCFINFC